MKPTSGSVRFPILGFRINETLDELSELVRHRCNAHDLSHVLCCMDICSRFGPVTGYLCLRRYRQAQVYHSRDIKPHTLDKS